MQLNLEGLLKKNHSLDNLHAGQPCYILGSGPSIKSQNIKLLKHEVKIAVNWFQNHPDCVAIDPQYWVIADPNAQESHEYFLDPLLNFMLENNFRPKLFMPINSLNYFATVTGAGFLDLHFFAYDRGRTLLEKLDFCKTIPEFGQNVVIPALMLALYLGCNPIYLIGCDHDWWAWTKDNWLSNNLDHFYSKAPPKSVSELHSFEDLQRTIRVQKFQYNQIKHYADSRGVSIFNATNGGHLEVFPRADFNRIWNNSKPLDVPISGLIDGDKWPSPGYGSTAVNLMNQGDNVSALVLIERAIVENSHHSDHVVGLDYLRALCLARLGRFSEALHSAHTSMLREPHLNPICEVLVQDLEQKLASKI